MNFLSKPGKGQAKSQACLPDAAYSSNVKSTTLVISELDCQLGTHTSSIFAARSGRGHCYKWKSFSRSCICASNFHCELSGRLAFMEFDQFVDADESIPRANYSWFFERGIYCGMRLFNSPFVLRSKTFNFLQSNMATVAIFEICIKSTIEL